MAKQVKRKLINFIILTVTLAVSCVTLPVMSVAHRQIRGSIPIPKAKH